MLVSEAARLGQGIFGGADILGAPACAMIAATDDHGNAVASFACIGNRVLHRICADDELLRDDSGKALAGMLERTRGDPPARTRSSQAYHTAAKTQ